MKDARRFGFVLLVLSTTLVSTGCFGRGISLQVPDSPSKKACTQYAKAFNEGIDRESVTRGVNEARAMAASSDDADAQRLAQAIDQVLTLSIMGTEETFLAANDEVLRLCSEAGLSITME